MTQKRQNYMKVIALICCGIFTACANKQTQLTIEEIKEKADFVLLYKKAYDLKNPSSDDNIPEIVGFSLNSEKTEDSVVKREITLYFANGKSETLEPNLVFTYSELKNMGDVEIAKQLGPEYIDKIELLDKESIYMNFANGDSMVFDPVDASFTYTHKGKEIFYPVDKIAFAKKMGLPSRP